MSFNHLMDAFFLYFLGVGMSLFALVCECERWRRRRRRRAAKGAQLPPSAYWFFVNEGGWDLARLY